MVESFDDEAAQRFLDTVLPAVDSLEMRTQIHALEGALRNYVDVGTSAVSNYFREVRLDCDLVNSVIRGFDGMPKLNGVSYNRSGNDPRLDALIRERQGQLADLSASGRSGTSSFQNPASLTDAELLAAISDWSDTDDYLLLDGLLRERHLRLKAHSILGTAEALDIPIDYAEMLVVALNVAPGEIVVGFGGIDLNRPDIRERIELTPAEDQFEGFINALLATAVSESQLADLQASEDSAARGYTAWANGERIDTNDLAAHNLELQTGGVEGYGTWFVIRNEQGIAIAAWYDAPSHLNAFDNMTLAESTAAFRRGLALATEQDETYQAFLDSGDRGETNAAAFAFASTGDETLAEDVRLGAWPGNYDGAVSESAITDPHIWLDGIGLVPVVGEVADLVNSGLYVIEGEYKDAAISAAATVPFLGNLAPARRVANRLGGEVIDSVQTAQGQIIHTVRRADGTTARIVELADGQIIQGPSTLVQRQAQPPSPTPLLDNGIAEVGTEVLEDGTRITFRPPEGPFVRRNPQRGPSPDIRPDTTYVADGYTFTTDELGRPVSAAGTLRLETATRTQESTRIGKLGNAGDEGGHLIGAQFGGPPDAFNLTPQAMDLNRGAGSELREIETEWADALEQGSEVRVSVVAQYGDDGLRPTSYDIEWEIDGEFFDRTLLNN